MDGLGKNENRIFLKVSDGQITMNVKEGTPDAKSRVWEDKTYWYLGFNNVHGLITSIKKNSYEKDSKSFDSLHIYIDKGNGRYILSMPYSSSVARNFYNKMELIDYSKEVVISASLDNNGYSQIFIQQNDVWLKNKYSKDNPGEKPMWNRVIVNGKDIWDRTDELAYFQNIIDAVILPQIEAAKSNNPARDALINEGNGIEKTKSNTDDSFPTHEPANLDKSADDDVPF